MNKYILVSKFINNSGVMSLVYAPIISYNKDSGSGIFISQNNRITQVVSKEVYEKAALGQIKHVTYNFN